jgi:hypothetical protein
MLTDLVAHQSAAGSTYQSADNRMADRFTDQSTATGSDTGANTGVGATDKRDRKK